MKIINPPGAVEAEEREWTRMAGMPASGQAAREAAKGTPGCGPAGAVQGQTRQDGQAREGRLQARAWPPVETAGGHSLEVTIIRPGRSHNGMHYRAAVLEQSVPLWEGAAAFCDHPSALDETRAGGRSVRDLVGVYTGARYEAGPGGGEGGVRATLRLYPNAGWLFSLLQAAMADREAGRAAPDIGISADMRVLKERSGEDWEVRRIVAVNSADVVFRPSAGGRFERVVEGGTSPLAPLVGARGPTSPLTPPLNGRGTSGRPPLAPPFPSGLPSARRDEGKWDRGLGPTPFSLEGRRAGDEGRTSQIIQEEIVETTTNDYANAAGAAREAREELARLQQMREEVCGQVLEARLGASDLPAAGREKLRRQFAGRAFEAEELDREIGSLRQMIGQAMQAQVVRGMGVARPGSGHGGAGISLGSTAREKLQMAVDRLFGLEVADSSVPRLSGIREAYVLITGDRSFSGRYNWEESVVREANEVTTSILADTLLNSLTKRLVKDYEAQPRWWRPIVRVAGISDMREQNRVLLNDFAALSTVAENGPYTNLAWGDGRENYTPGKRGNLVVVTLESILNDDLHAITRIPVKLAAAAAITLNEFVSTLFTANAGAGPAMADTNNVFDAANHQGNSGTTALSSAAVQAATIAMLKYTNSASKRLGAQPRYLLVPPDLAFTAQVITESAQVPGSANNDANVLRGALVPVVVPQWTDTNNWYLMADPAVVEGIEMGFLNGQEAPELLVQDQPANGSVFTNDAISYKVRHIFGGGWLDYRAGYASIVA